MMHHLHDATPGSYRRAISILPVLGMAVLLGVSSLAEAQMPPAAPAVEEAELPHAFFTHMGLPEGVGVFNFGRSGSRRASMAKPGPISHSIWRPG